MSALAERFVLIRDVTRDECHWLDDRMVAGEVVFRFTGPTYGVIDHDSGMACSASGPKENPFFELPRDALVEYD